jgi:hypothetical protein
MDKGAITASIGTHILFQFQKPIFGFVFVE